MAGVSTRVQPAIEQRSPGRFTHFGSLIGMLPSYWPSATALLLSAELPSAADCTVARATTFERPA